MNGTITADHPTFVAVVADLRAAADELRAERDRITREVDDLLGTGWSGAAATAFAEGWSDWRRAAATVLDGLVAMGNLVEAAHADLVRSDLSSQADLDRVAARIVARLG